MNSYPRNLKNAPKMKQQKELPKQPQVEVWIIGYPFIHSKIAIQTKRTTIENQ